MDTGTLSLTKQGPGSVREHKADGSQPFPSPGKVTPYPSISSGPHPPRGRSLALPVILNIKIQGRKETARGGSGELSRAGTPAGSSGGRAGG